MNINAPLGTHNLIVNAVARAHREVAQGCKGVYQGPTHHKSLEQQRYLSQTVLFLQITRSPWAQRTSGANVHFTVSVAEQLQPGTNCTFYVCYWYYDSSFFPVYGRESPASCITGKAYFKERERYTLHHHFFFQNKNFIDWHSQQAIQVTMLPIQW